MTFNWNYNIKLDKYGTERVKLEIKEISLIVKKIFF